MLYVLSCLPLVAESDTIQETLSREASVTIAACYVSPEGLVLGADSTTTYVLNGANHYFNHAQKLFEIGEDSTLGIVTWGLGGLGLKSYRSLIATLSDNLAATPPTSVADVCEKWIDIFWQEYVGFAGYARWEVLNKKAAHDPAQPAPDKRTEDEEREFTNLSYIFVVGFCLGGRLSSDRSAAAYQMIFDPKAGRPSPVEIPLGSFSFWGAPNIVSRLIFACDGNLSGSILKSPHWSGTAADLQTLLNEHHMMHPPNLPVREAIDFVNFCIFSTIKALKFSNFSQICGGPIEIAVITSDRKFRWIRHKPLDSAVTEGEPQ